jgi:protein SCO1/2
MRAKNLILVISAAVIAMAVGFWLAGKLFEPDKLSGPQSTPDGLHGYMLSPARKIAVPPLVKGNGATFTADDLKGHWSVMFYGYTNCPDICPTTMAVLTQAKSKAASEGIEFPQVIFVSVDPERDKIEMLGDYVRYFDEDFIGVTGETKMINALAVQMSVVYMRVPSVTDDPNNYQVDHSAAILLLNPQGQLAAFLTAPHTPAGILDSIKAVIAKSS